MKTLSNKALVGFGLAAYAGYKFLNTCMRLKKEDPLYFTGRKIAAIGFGLTVGSMAAGAITTLEEVFLEREKKLSEEICCCGCRDLKEESEDLKGGENERESDVEQE